MASNALTVEIGVRWWVLPYLKTLSLFGLLTGCRPDERKAARFIVRHDLTTRKV